MVSKTRVGSPDLAHIVGKTRDAAIHGPDGMSTGEKLTVALVLNRPDWLTDMNYTIAEAMERIGPDWCRLIPAAAQQFKRECELAAEQTAVKKHEARVATFSSLRESADETLDFSAAFITSGNAPGYRDVYLTFDLTPKGVRSDAKPTMRARLSLSPADGESVIREITDVHRFAWRKDSPIDAKPGESRPRWLNED